MSAKIEFSFSFRFVTKQSVTQLSEYDLWDGQAE